MWSLYLAASGKHYFGRGAFIKTAVYYYAVLTIQGKMR